MSLRWRLIIVILVDVLVFCPKRTTFASLAPTPASTLRSPPDTGRPQIEPGTTWKLSGCISIPLNFTLCRGAGYSQMHLPNLLQHQNLSQAIEKAASWAPLVDAGCHPDAKIFLCSLLAPICHVRPIWPCRKLCLSVRGSCESSAAGARGAGVPWPQDLACDRLPSDSRNALCISDQKHQRSKGENRCSACAQPDTLEGIVDHFCRVDTAMRLTVDRVVLSAPNVKIIGSKAKIIKQRKTSTTNEDLLLRTPIVVDSGTRCSCLPLWNRSDVPDPPETSNSNGTQYLVMGTTARRQGGGGGQRRVQVSFLRPFNASSRPGIRALSAMQRNNLCSTGIKHLLLMQQQQQQQQATRNRKKTTKKKENKQKTKTKKKQFKALDRQKAQIANKTTKTQNRM